MEVVPTGDGDEDDGVIWFRCPQCQGFLPKLSGADLQGPDETAPAESGDGATGADPAATPAHGNSPQDDAPDSMPWDSPADMMAALAGKSAATDESAAESASDDDLVPEVDVDLDLDALPPEVIPPADDEDEDPATTTQEEENSGEPEEPIMEYAAMLADLDPAEGESYRPWGTYEVGQCIHHLAWDDCGVVVAKETLPGGRQVIKVYFEEAGVVRLIEQAPR